MAVIFADTDLDGGGVVQANDLISVTAQKVDLDAGLSSFLRFGTKG